MSVKDKLTLSLGVAVGSSIVRATPSYTAPPVATNRYVYVTQQIALFVIPFIVTLGWIIGKPLSLLFDPFESIVLFFSGEPLSLSTLLAFSTRAFDPAHVRRCSSPHLCPAVIVVNYVVQDGKRYAYIFFPAQSPRTRC